MTIYFPDVSDFQAGLSLNGATAVIAKATEGTDWTDTAYPGFKAQADQLGIPFAGYHYMDSADLQAQAEHAFNHIGAGIGTMWDCEASGDVVSRIVELTSRYRALGGNATLVYLPHWFWQQIGSPDLRPLAEAGLALISSSYPPGGYSDDGVGWQPYGGVTPSIWQYTDRQQFNGQLVDFDAFKGTVDELRVLFNGAGQTPSAPKEIDMLRYLFVNFADLPSEANGRIHCTDGVRYRIEPKGKVWQDIMAAAGAPAASTIDGSTLDGATYASAVGTLCGMRDLEAGDAPAAHQHDVVGTTGPAQPAP